jgi:glycerophosphoryl diester phosphodiesterase
MSRNTLPSFGAAVAVGAHEIEFDIWGSKDNKLVICHDKSIDRTSNGKGDICNLEWSFLSKLDTGCWFGKGWENIPFCTLEDIFKNFAGQVVMNIHLKESGKNGWIIKIVRDLAFEHEMSSKIYITGDKDVLKYCLKYAPDIERCCLEGQEDMTIVEWAINYKCRRLQFAKNKFNTKMIEKAHTNNIICNLSYTDTVEEAARALKKGINAILTNYCNRLLPIIPIEI